MSFRVHCALLLEPHVHKEEPSEAGLYYTFLAYPGSYKDPSDLARLYFLNFGCASWLPQVWVLLLDPSVLCRTSCERHAPGRQFQR